ncbi:hypothetical protein EJD97_009500 [Solanum chilense]|uniref:Uncharacterized protein n=1 Tax=Solanum chilense TaxID=4083 RepID=A0A6N2CFM5_SOLCI|nr:hypothetical protein EJD97_009500 [Solanum chilense]
MVCRECEQEVNNQPRRSKWSKSKSYCQNFSQWFETRASQKDVPALIKQFSREPNLVAKRYYGYPINGYKFHLMQHNTRSKTQNSGVTLVASTTSFASSKDNPIAANLTYYGRIVDIVELDYYVGPSIPKDNSEVLLTRTDFLETVIDIPLEEFITQQLEDEYEEEFKDEFEDKTENESEDEPEDESDEEFDDETP